MTAGVGDPALDVAAIREHISILHRLAQPAAGQGKLLIASFGENPDRPHPKTGAPGWPLEPKIRHSRSAISTG